MTAPLSRGSGPGPLAAETSKRTDAPTRMRVGVVLSASGNTTTVSIAGGTVTAGRLTSYSASSGDRVLLLLVLDSWVILGKIVGPGS